MKSARTPKDMLIVPVASAITLAWLASLVAGMFEQSFIALEVTTPAMLLVAGYVFGVSIVKGSQSPPKE
jgi:hypothetical protein